MAVPHFLSNSSIFIVWHKILSNTISINDLVAINDHFHSNYTGSALHRLRWLFLKVNHLSIDDWLIRLCKIWDPVIAIYWILPDRGVKVSDSSRESNSWCVYFSIFPINESKVKAFHRERSSRPAIDWLIDCEFINWTHLPHCNRIVPLHHVSLMVSFRCQMQKKINPLGVEKLHDPIIQRKVTF